MQSRLGLKIFGNSMAYAMSTLIAFNYEYSFNSKQMRFNRDIHLLDLEIDKSPRRVYAKEVSKTVIEQACHDMGFAKPVSVTFQRMPYQVRGLSVDAYNDLRQSDFQINVQYRDASDLEQYELVYALAGREAARLAHYHSPIFLALTTSVIPVMLTRTPVKNSFFLSFSAVCLLMSGIKKFESVEAEITSANKLGTAQILLDHQKQLSAIKSDPLKIKFHSGKELEIDLSSIGKVASVFRHSPGATLRNFYLQKCVNPKGPFFFKAPVVQKGHSDIEVTNKPTISNR